MIRRIELVNFMSHARTVIEPAEGLTVLVGPNNCGKSAVVAALQILCHNENSTYVTRHNEKECSVTIETDEGHIVEWRRKNNSPRYTINGKPFDRLDRGGVPEELHEVLRLPKVVADGNREFDVHFGEQKSPVFLVDKPGSYAAQFFASSSDTASLIEMQKRHQQKMGDARRERLQLEVRAAKLATDLAALAATNQIETDVVQVESRYEELGALTSHIGQFTQDVRELGEVIALLDLCQSEATAFAALTLPPMLINPQPLRDIVGTLARTELEVERQSALAASVSVLPTPPDISDERPLVALISELQSNQSNSLRLHGHCIETRELVPLPMMIEFEALQRIVAGIESLSRDVAASEQRFSLLAPITNSPELENEAFLTRDVLALAQALEAVQRGEEVHGQLNALVAAPDLADTRAIGAMILDLSRAVSAVTSRTRDLVEAEHAMREAESLLRTWAEEKQLCPTCGGPLDPNQVVLHAGLCDGGNPNV